MLPFLVRFQPRRQPFMYANEWIYPFLIFGPAHAERFPIGGDPARLVRLGIRPHSQCFTRPQASERFKHHLPAQCFGADVSKQQRRDFVQRFGIVRHEFPAVPDIFGAAVTRTPEVDWILLNEIAPHSPKDCIAHRVEFHVHRPVAASFRGVLSPPCVVTVKLDQGNITHRKFVPELQQDGTIPGFHLQGAANARLFLAIWIAVFLVAADDFSQHHGSLSLILLESATPRMATMCFFAGVLEVFGFQGAPRPFPAHLRPVKIGARCDVSINAGFHTFKLCRPDPDEFACRIHVVFAFCLARYNEKFSSGEKDVV